MQAEIKFIPQEGAKSINKAMVRSYDSQGIMMSEDAISEKKGEDGEKQDKLNVTVDVPRNGRIEIEAESMAEVDAEQKAAIPPEDEQTDQVREETKKANEDREKRRQESLHRAALERGVAYQPATPFPGSPVAQHPTSAAGPQAAPGQPHMEQKGKDADLSKNPSPTTPQAGAGGTPADPTKRK